MKKTYKLTAPTLDQCIQKNQTNTEPLLKKRSIKNLTFKSLNLNHSIISSLQTPVDTPDLNQKITANIINRYYDVSMRENIDELSRVFAEGKIPSIKAISLPCSLSINKNLQITACSNEFFELSIQSIKNLGYLLKNLPTKELKASSEDVFFLHKLYKFTNYLIYTAGIIPQVLQSSSDTYYIRWIPLLLSSEVKDLFKQLVAACPEKFIVYKDATISQAEQVKIGISLIYKAYINAGHKNISFYNKNDHAYATLFNTGEPTKLTPDEVHALQTILLPLSLAERDYNPIIKITSFKNNLYKADTTIEYHHMPGKHLPIEIALVNTTPEKAAIIKNDMRILSKVTKHLGMSPYSALYDLNGMSMLLNKHDCYYGPTIDSLQKIQVKVELPQIFQNIIIPEFNLVLTSTHNLLCTKEQLNTLDTAINYTWNIALGDKTISIEDYKKLTKLTTNLHIEDNQCISLNTFDLHPVERSIHFFPSKKLSRIELIHAALSGTIKKEDRHARVTLDAPLQKFIASIQQSEQVPVPKTLHATLRPYQERGFQWLVQNIKSGFGSILADDMGLGKTIQVIAAILYLKEHKLIESSNPVLIVAPTSILNNWQHELKKFAPSLKTTIYHGASRTLDKKVDALITSYGIVRQDKALIESKEWGAVIIDEAQNIKNPTTDQTIAIKSLKSQHKIALSGTPVENKLIEYWSIFDFTNQHYLGTATEFKTKFVSAIEYERNADLLTSFKKICGPFVLRRLKTDKSIINDLPDKIENNRYCALTAEQEKLYMQIVDGSLIKIKTAEGIERKGHILNLITLLKQVCNHPYQVKKGKKDPTIAQSGKMALLEDLLKEILESKEKALIFTQYVETGELIVQLMSKCFQQTITFLHGGLTIKQRAALVDDFQTNPENHFFVISLKAGGTGLNLTAATHIIHYDLWWNPAAEAQANDRAYRIGQNKNVMVHRFITSDTFEEEIDEIIQRKKELAYLTVEHGEKWITEMSTEQIAELVKLKHRD